MKVLRSTATPPEVTTTLLFGNEVTQCSQILTPELAPIKFLKVQGKKGTSQEVVENKELPQKKMLKMKEPPNNFIKTQGQFRTSREVIDNAGFRLFWR
jgi:hypothetical protein